MPENVIRVIVVEDHHVVRAGLIALLGMANDIQVVADAADGIEAVKQFRLQRPDVTLIDLRIPGLSGVEVIRNICHESEQARFIVLTAHEGEEDVFRAIEAGAHAYLLKGSTNDELIATIRLVHEGKSCFSSRIAEILAQRNNAQELTARETVVLKKIVQGMTNKKIAMLLGISEGTVKTHVNNLLSKLGVVDRTQAATAALLRGIVTLDYCEPIKQSADASECKTPF